MGDSWLEIVEVDDRADDLADRGRGGNPVF
jgi:hypothetical protein